MKRGISLRTKLIAAFTIVSLVSILTVTALSVNNARDMLTNKAGVLITAINDQFGLSIDNFFDDYEEKGAMVFSSEDVYSFDPTKNTLGEYETIQVKAQIASQLAVFGTMISYNDFCLVYSDNSSVGTLSSTTAQTLRMTSPIHPQRSPLRIR